MGFSFGKLQPGRRFDWQICSLCFHIQVFSPVCRRLRFICFHSLMACHQRVSHISFCHWGFSSFFFFLSLLLLQLWLSPKEKGSFDPTTPISLETDEAASLLPLHASFCPLLLHPPPLPLMTSLCRPWQTQRSATFRNAHGRKLGVYWLCLKSPHFWGLDSRLMEHCFMKEQCLKDVVILINSLINVMILINMRTGVWL